MKTFKELMEEKAITENLDEIQEMAYTEVQIICDNAKRIMDMMDEGIEPESWNYSKITLAADYLTTVYTAMRAKKSEMPSYDSYYEETDLTEVTGGKVVATENGYPIHDMGSNFPHKDKRFMIKDPIINVWQASAPTLTDAKKKAKALKPAEGRGLGKRTDHDDWSNEQKRRISSGEVRRAVMSRRSNSLYSESITDKDKVLVHSHKMGTDTGKYGVFNVEKVTSTHLTAHDHNTGKKIKFNLKSKRGIGDASELMIKKIMTEETNLKESKLDDFRAELIHRAVSEYADGKKDIRGVSLDKIATAFASKKNFGTKAQDELEKELNLPIGVIKSITRDVQAELKANFSVGRSSGQTQAQRIDRYLKQKWVK